MAIPGGIRIPRSVAHYGVFFYGDGHGGLIPLIDGSFYNAATSRAHVIGIYIDNNIHPIYDSAGVQVFLTLPFHQLIPVTPELHAKYDRLFVGYRPATPPRTPKHLRQDSPDSRPSQRRRLNARE